MRTFPGVISGTSSKCGPMIRSRRVRRTEAGPVIHPVVLGAANLIGAVALSREVQERGGPLRRHPRDGLLSRTPASVRCGRCAIGVGRCRRSRPGNGSACAPPPQSWWPTRARRPGWCANAVRAVCACDQRGGYEYTRSRRGAVWCSRPPSRGVASPVASRGSVRATNGYRRVGLRFGGGRTTVGRCVSCPRIWKPC